MNHPASDTEWTLALAGDVMLGRLVNRVLLSRPPEYVWGDHWAALRAADLRFINLECVISDRGSPWQPGHKMFHFRAHPKAIAVLRAAGIDGVSLANNHTLDYGAEALRDCLRRLDEAGIRRAGAGETLEDAARPALLHVHGLRVAVIACTDNMPEWAVEAQSPGVFFVEPGDPGSEARLLGRIRALRPQADVVVLTVHWGPNMVVRPSAERVHLAHQAIAAGADIVHGHSAHVFQGIEVYGERLILYDTGDFVDDYAVDPHLRNDWGFLFLVRLRGNRVTGVELVPSVIGEMQARAAGSLAPAIMARMTGLCRELGTATREREGRLWVEVGKRGVHAARAG